MKKKGTSTDAVVLLVALLAIAIVLIIGVAVHNTMRDALTPVFGESGNATMAQVDSSIATTDTFFMIFWFALAMGGLVSAFFVKTHPAFLGLSLVFIIPLLLLGPIFTNVYENFSNTTFANSTLTTLSKTNAFMNNLYIFNFIFVVALFIVLYISFRSGD